MSTHTFRPPTPRSELGLSLLLGGAFASLLFVLMALAQMMSGIRAPDRSLDETLVAFNAPEMIEIEEEPPPPEEEEPPPELEKEPPQLSLDQLDIALNPGTGGSLAGDFAMPTIGTSARDLGTEDFVDFSDLDQMPRPLAPLHFPSRLKRKKARGKVVVLIKLNEEGRVMDVELDSSTLPAFNSFVLSALRDIPFSPPTRQGQPVKAKARLPIPINIQ